MLSNRVLREIENVSSVSNSNKLLGSEKKPGIKTKSKALGDVRNTLHARPANASFAKTPNPKLNTAIKKPAISSGFLSTGKKTLKKNIAKCDLVENNSNSNREDDLEVCDHNHDLCIKAEDPCFTNYLYEYKLSEKDIENLVNSIKPLRLSVPKLQHPSMEPCADIEIYDEAWDTKSSDMSEELIMPEIPAPVNK